jgi:GT2 family glycosyltransferase
MVDLSITIVNWNTKNHLANCLDSIYQNAKDAAFEIIVVDNDSDDNSAEMVRAKFPQVTLIENNENVGFGAANNQAIRISQGRYVLILNPDTLVLPGCLDQLMDLLASRPDVGAVGPKVVNVDGSIQLPCIRNVPTLFTEYLELSHLSARFPKSRVFGRYYMTYCDRSLPRQVSLLMGCCIMVRKKVLDEIGLFDEQFFLYAEDMDLCYRIQKAGWKSWYLPTAQIVHIWGQSTERISKHRVFHNQQAKYIFFKKHFGAAKAFEYRLATLLAAITVYLEYGFLYPLSSRENKIRLNNAVCENHRILRWVFGSSKGINNSC